MTTAAEEPMTAEGLGAERSTTVTTTERSTATEPPRVTGTRTGRRFMAKPGTARSVRTPRRGRHGLLARNRVRRGQRTRVTADRR